MPFNLGNASRYMNDILISFNGEELALTYNSGSKYQLFQRASRRYEKELADLQRKIERGDLEVNVSDDASTEEKRKAADAAYDELMSKVQKARRDIADNICIVIEKWDLEATEDLSLDDIKENMSPAEKKKNKDVSGTGLVPISGEWLDALPLPDEFIIEISRKITEDFSNGGSGTKKG